MWKSGIAAGFIDILAVNKMLKRGDLVIHTIHGEMWNTALSTFPPQDKTFYFHKVIHALIVHKGVEQFRPSGYDPSVHSECR